MEASAQMQEKALLEQGRASLQDLLGTNWEVTFRADQLPEGDHGWDAMLEIKSADGVYVQMLVDARRRVTPKDAAGPLTSMAHLVRRVSQYTRILVIAPWISPLTQEALRANGIDYLDLSGNISLRVSRPAIVIHTHGADRAPAGHRPPSSKPLLTGLKAGRLVRLLADVAPPYRASALAQGAGLSLPYVSRLLDTLDDQLLIERDGKVIVSVDWQGLLRARANQTDLLRNTEPAGMIAPNGVAAVLNRLTVLNHDIIGSPRELLVTGSYAARSLAPISVGGQLMLYVQEHPLNVETWADELGLMPVSEGAEVLILRAKDDSVWQRPMMVGGLWQVGLSQLATDCLSGPGRMPAEGEKILEFMAENEHVWRKTDLSHQSEATHF
ncbi:helix-turn-helix domain-containing protein [Streptomyces globisporus]|uniref:helix-turn-helix domain-containing protein n=1 Tax=Streptomyces globisporus TaxID=1908 RepID=UPI00381E054E